MLRKLLALTALLGVAALSLADTISTTGGAYSVSSPSAGGTLALTVKESGGTQRAALIANPAPSGGGLLTLGSTTTSVIETLGLIRAGDGAVGTPGFAFQDDPNTGLYNAGLDAISIVAGGTQQLEVTTTTIRLNLPLRHGADGLITAPSYSFVNDTDIGLYRPGADSISMVAGGTPQNAVRANPSGVVLSVGSGDSVVAEIASTNELSVSTGQVDILGSLTVAISDPAAKLRIFDGAAGSAVGMYVVDTGTANDCSLICDSTEVSHGLDADSGACIRGWVTATGADVACSDTTVGRHCLCVGFDI